MDLSRTRAAVIAYDGDRPRRDGLWAAADTSEAVWAAQAADKAAADVVREAFAADSSNVNQRDRAFLINPDDPWFRKLLDRDGSRL